MTEQTLDPRQCFTLKQFQTLEKDIDLETEIKQPHFNRKDFSDSYPYTPTQVEVYLDERLVLVKQDGLITFEIYIPTDYISESTFLKIEGLPAYARKKQVLLFDHLEGVQVKM